MNVIPGYGVRELVVDGLGDEDPRTSYDFYQQYLSDPAHQCTHLDHAIFYLASSFFHVEFIIVALLSDGRDNPSLYHRRINMVADSRRTIVVSHSHHHYNLLDVKAGDTVSLTTLLNLPLHVQTARWMDRDWCWGMANKERVVVSVEELDIDNPSTADRRRVTKEGRSLVAEINEEGPRVRSLHTELVENLTHRQLRGRSVPVSNV
jgi:hypothetical protein